MNRHQTILSQFFGNLSIGFDRGDSETEAFAFSWGKHQRMVAVKPVSGIFVRLKPTEYLPRCLAVQCQIVWSLEAEPPMGTESRNHLIGCVHAGSIFGMNEQRREVSSRSLQEGITVAACQMQVLEDAFFMPVSLFWPMPMIGNVLVHLLKNGVKVRIGH